MALLAKPNDYLRPTSTIPYNFYKQGCLNSVAHIAEPQRLTVYTKALTSIPLMKGVTSLVRNNGWTLRLSQAFLVFLRRDCYSKSNKPSR